MTTAQYGLQLHEELGLVLVREAARRRDVQGLRLDLALPDVEPYTGATAEEAQAIHQLLLTTYEGIYAEELPEAIKEAVEGAPPGGLAPAAAAAMAVAIVAAWRAKRAVRGGEADLLEGLIGSMAFAAGAAALAGYATMGPSERSQIDDWSAQRSRMSESSIEATVSREAEAFLKQQLQTSTDRDRLIRTWDNKFVEAPPDEPSVIAMRAERAARSEARDAYNFGVLTALKGQGTEHVMAHDASDGTDTETDLRCQQRNGRVFTIEDAFKQSVRSHPNCTLYFTPLEDGQDVDVGLSWDEDAAQAERRLRHPDWHWGEDKHTSHVAKMLSREVELHKQHGPVKGREYASPEELVLREGKEYKAPTGEMPEKYARMKGEPKMCFRNTAQLVQMHPELKYVEGYAALPDLPLAFHHAWAVDRDGNVVDPTWKPTPGTTYRGVEFPGDSALEFATKAGHWGVFDHQDTHRLLERQWHETQVLMNVGRSAELENQLGTSLDLKNKHTNKAGEYTPEQLAFHEGIKHGLLAGHSSQEQPHVLFTAGGPASGKSVMLKSDKVEKPEDAVHIDPDEIMSMFPEVKALYAANDPHAAAVGHAEASDVASQVRDDAVAQKMNLIVDGVGNSVPGRFSGKVKHALDEGYKVGIAYADVPVELAKQRSKERGEKQGRYVPESVIEHMHAASAARFDEILPLMPRLERLTVHDTTDPEPKLLAHMDPDSHELVIDDPEGYARWRAKADPTDVALAEVLEPGKPEELVPPGAPIGEPIDYVDWIGTPVRYQGVDVGLSWSEAAREAADASHKAKAKLRESPWVDPPDPLGRVGQHKAGGISAIGVTNTAVGDAVEHALVQHLGLEDAHPGRRQGPFDVKNGKDVYEVKAATRAAQNYRAKPDKKEVEGKLAYAREHGLNPHTIIAVYDHELKQAHIYSKPGVANFSLTTPERGWKYHGHVPVDVHEGMDLDELLALSWSDEARIAALLSRRAKKNWLDGNAKETVRRYVGAERNVPHGWAASEVNSALRQGVRPPAASELDRAIVGQGQIGQDAVLHRSVGGDHPILSGSGKHIERGYMSTTASPDVLQSGFLGKDDKHLVLHIDPRVHALGVDNAFDQPTGEKEILLQRDLVMHRIHEDPEGRVHVRVEPPEDGPYIGGKGLYAEEDTEPDIGLYDHFHGWHGHFASVADMIGKGAVFGANAPHGSAASEAALRAAGLVKADGTVRASGTRYDVVNSRLKNIESTLKVEKPGWHVSHLEVNKGPGSKIHLDWHVAPDLDAAEFDHPYKATESQKAKLPSTHLLKDRFWKQQGGGIKTDMKDVYKPISKLKPIPYPSPDPELFNKLHAKPAPPASPSSIVGEKMPFADMPVGAQWKNNQGVLVEKTAHDKLEWKDGMEVGASTQVNPSTFVAPKKIVYITDAELKQRTEAAIKELQSPHVKAAFDHPNPDQEAAEVVLAAGKMKDPAAALEVLQPLTGMLGWAELIKDRDVRESVWKLREKLLEEVSKKDGTSHGSWRRL